MRPHPTYSDSKPPYRSARWTVAVAFVVLLLSACAPGHPPARWSAAAPLRPTAGNSGSGIVRISEQLGGIDFVFSASGLPAGAYRAWLFTADCASDHRERTELLLLFAGDPGEIGGRMLVQDIPASEMAGRSVGMTDRAGSLVMCGDIPSGTSP